MKTDEIIALSNVRLERAKECLSDAQATLEEGRFKTAVNRSYYAVYNAIRSVLAFDGIDMKRHSGTISEFRKLYIKTNIFSEDMSDKIGVLFNVRQKSDYDDFYVISKEETIEQVRSAQEIIENIEQYIINRSKILKTSLDETNEEDAPILTMSDNSRK